MDATDINLHMVSTVNNRKQNTNISKEETNSNYTVDAELDMQSDINLKVSDDKLKQIEDNVTTISKLLIITLVVVTLNI